MSAQIEDNPFSRCGLFAGKHLHLGISGSIACYRAADLVRAFTGIGILVSATLSPGAKEFITPLLIRALGAEPVYDGMFNINGVFDHLRPGQEAEAMLVAPASADMLAKMANGIADDMLAAQYLAFPGQVVLAPAMNPYMWANAATIANVKLLRGRGAIIAEPEKGRTACGQEGRGRLAALPEIFLNALRCLSIKDMKGLKVLVTLGPTREAWDGVRFWSNPSTGQMGGALATAAWLRGAEVTAICGPGISVYLPKGIRRLNVTGAREMHEEAVKFWPHSDIAVCSAAVADFAPVPPENGRETKIGKDTLGEGFDMQFRRNPDILATLARSKRPVQKTLGFAAEIAVDLESLLPLARKKRLKKNADIIAGNLVNAEGGAFGAATDRMAVVDRNGREEIWNEMPKAEVAWDLLTWLLKL